jgi:hypothetical protein
MVTLGLANDQCPILTTPVAREDEAGQGHGCWTQVGRREVVQVWGPPLLMASCR